MMDVLDLFSAAAGGWSLGMHRAGFRTVAACEFVPWRRALYAQNNPGVLIYDDVRILTADRIISDLGYFPGVVVGSPPCQDISPANTKGKGVEGERSALFFEAVRVIGEGQPRWFALENSANLRTRGADAVLSALEGLGYACWAFVVRAGDIGANHERPRSWLIGCDLAQVTDADGFGWDDERRGRRCGINISVSDDPFDASCLGRESGRPWRHGPDGNGSASASRSDVGDAAEDGCGPGRAWRRAAPTPGLSVASCRDDADAVGERPQGLAGGAWRGWQGQEPEYPVADVAHPDCRRQPDCPVNAEMGGGPSLGGDVAEPWPDWNGGLADHLRLDDGLSAWVASTRIAVGGPRGTSGASLLVEAFGDAVVPQIPEAIGRAIRRTEAALTSIYSRAAA